MPNSSQRKSPNLRTADSAGFTLIELMIVVAIITVILTLALPVYSNYAIRANIGKALRIANAAKTAVSTKCLKDPAIATINPDNMDYEPTEPTRYVANITFAGPCTEPLIMIQTRNTGIAPDPVIELIGQVDSERMQFTCAVSAAKVFLPKACRS